MRDDFLEVMLVLMKRYMLLFTLPSEENSIVCTEENGDG
jgi:hypothetical protein